MLGFSNYELLLAGFFKGDAMLLIIEQMLDKVQLENLRAQYDLLQFADGRATAGERAAEVKRNLQLPNDTPEHALLSEMIHHALASSSKFMSAMLPLQLSPPLFNRYLAGMGFGEHVDNAIRIDGESPLRADVSMTIMLSSPQEYDGGELVIEDVYGTQRLKLAAGSIVIYPSSSLHRVEAIRLGQRDVVVLWGQSMVRDAGQRALLYRLDQSIQNIRRQTPESSEIDSLLATYNNLLRMWADI